MPVLASIKPLPWESEFFALSSGRLQLTDAASAQADSPGTELPLTDPQLIRQLAAFSLVQAKVPTQRTGWLDVLQRQGFRLVEGECDFVLSVTEDTLADPALAGLLADQLALATASPASLPISLPASLPSSAISAPSSVASASATTPLTLTIAEERHIAPLQQLATVFRFSRFREPWYAADDSRRFYAQWLANAVRGTFDDQCLLLVNPQGGIAGFVTLRQLNPQQGRIGLLAGHGLGTTLIALARHWCASRQIRQLFVATQLANHAAIRCYLQNGGNLHTSAYWLYRR